MAAYEKLLDGHYWRREDDSRFFQTNYDKWLIAVEFGVGHLPCFVIFRHDGAYIGELSIARESDIPTFYTDDQKIESVLRRAMAVFAAVCELWSHLDD